MTNEISQFTAPSLSLSMMLSETVYRAVVGVERIYRAITA